MRSLFTAFQSTTSNKLKLNREGITVFHLRVFFLSPSFGVLLLLAGRLLAAALADFLGRSAFFVDAGFLEAATTDFLAAGLLSAFFTAFLGGTTGFLADGVAVLFFLSDSLVFSTFFIALDFNKTFLTLSIAFLLSATTYNLLVEAAGVFLAD